MAAELQLPHIPAKPTLDACNNMPGPGQSEELELQYKSCYARILDSKRRFLEAATRYYELSQVGARGAAGLQARTLLLGSSVRQHAAYSQSLARLWRRYSQSWSCRTRGNGNKKDTVLFVEVVWCSLPAATVTA